MAVNSEDTTPRAKSVIQRWQRFIPSSFKLREYPAALTFSTSGHPESHQQQIAIRNKNCLFFAPPNALSAPVSFFPHTYKLTERSRGIQQNKCTRNRSLNSAYTRIESIPWKIFYGNDWFKYIFTLIDIFLVLFLFLFILKKKTAPQEFQDHLRSSGSFLTIEIFSLKSLTVMESQKNRFICRRNWNSV